MDAEVVFLDPVDQQVKEVYARYGLAMCYAQCVERQLAIAMATVYGPGPTRITASQYDELLDNLFDWTFGGLIAKLRSDASVPADFEATLEDARMKRNFLAHRYFWERAARFMTDDGCRSMIAELTEWQELFAEIDGQFCQITLEWCNKHGVTHEMIAQEQERLIREASAPHS